jgi:ABC-type multidrug transport system ATPase subunit
MTREQFAASGGTDIQFDKLDTNGDNVITVDEVVLQGNHAAAVAADGANSPSTKKKEFAQTFDFKFEGLGLTLSNGITIMKGVNGQIKHGKVTAVMGPSGAGKTTFLNLLSGKAAKTHGDIFIKSTTDGKFELETDGIYRYRKLCGFVPQEDTMHRNLRVHDNIFFSGSFRLPHEFTSEDVYRRTDEVIATLGLGAVQHSKIGDETTRGVSGGQRKRVNIGMEVVANPRVLFLDEPTSGLDSTSSQEVLIALKKFATEEDMTIVTVIHQPRFEIYKLIDELLLLGRGGITVFIGPREEAETYFRDLGFHSKEEGMNPIDFFMDIISGDVPRDGDAKFVKEDLFDMWVKYAEKREQREKHPSNGTIPHMGSGSGTGISDKDFDMEFNSSSQGFGIGAGDGDIHSHKSPRGADGEQIVVSEPEEKKTRNCCAQCCCDCVNDFISWWSDLGLFFYQCLIESPCKPGFRKTPSLIYVFWIVMRRSWAQQYRDWGKFIAQNVLHLVLGMFLSALTSKGVTFIGPIPEGIVATCPFVLQGACTNPLQDDYLGVAGFLSWAIGFAGIAVGAATFGDEKPQFWREQGSGMNFIVYFYGKVLADLPKIAFAAACFTFALLAGFATNTSAIRVYGLVFFMYYSGFALGYLVSAFVGSDMSALLGVAIAMLFAIQLSGTSSPKLKDVNDGSNPITKTLFWLSFGRWGTEAFYINEMNHFHYENVGPYIEAQGFVLGDAQFGLDLLNMFLSSLVWQFIAMIFLKMNNRQAQK